MVGLEEIPLNVRSQWKNNGKFVLKHVGADPSWRARLGSHLIAEKERRMSAICNTDLGNKTDDLKTNMEPPDDKFLVCIFNVSPTVTHTMFHVSKTSTVSDVIKLALERGRKPQSLQQCPHQQQLQQGRKKRRPASGALQ